METTITSADICELAHEYTIKECQYKGITDIEKLDEYEIEIYTDEVQEIFNQHYDTMCELLGHNNK